MKIVQITLVSSLILNSFLLIYLFGIIPFILFLSVLVNVFIAFYVRFLINEKIEIQNDINSLMFKNEDFVRHLSTIYELEMFYGDETLQELLTHSKRLVSDYYDYCEKYYTSPEEEDEEENNLDELETTKYFDPEVEKDQKETD